MMVTHGQHECFREQQGRSGVVTDESDYEELGIRSCRTGRWKNSKALRAESLQLACLMKNK